MSNDDEHRAAKQAETVVNSLVPNSPRTDAKVFTLRYAATTASDAMHLPSATALGAARGEASRALNGLCVAMERNALTRDLIDRAQRAVAAWLKALGPA